MDEHKQFQGAVNAVFNSATTRHGIDYVVKSLMLDECMQAVVKRMYDRFLEVYRCIVTEGLSYMDSSLGQAFLSDLAFLPLAHTETA